MNVKKVQDSCPEPFCGVRDLWNGVVKNNVTDFTVIGYLTLRVARTISEDETAV